MTFGQLVKMRDRPSFDRRMAEMAVGVEIILAGYGIEIAGAGWRVRRADACTITVVLDDMDAGRRSEL